MLAQKLQFISVFLLYMLFVATKKMTIFFYLLLFLVIMSISQQLSPHNQLLPMPRPHNNHSHSHQSRNSSYSQPPIIYNQSPLDRTEYLCLATKDQIYYGNLGRCTSAQFQEAVRKLCRDLGMLLHFRGEDFWAEVTSQGKGGESLRKCLVSCLQIFPRHRYEMFKQKNTPVDIMLAQSTNNSTFQLFSVLMRTVLFIYHRIIFQCNNQQKEQLYSLWLLDIPKVFHLISIYGDSNRKLVKLILDKLFEKMPQYEDDVRDFVQIMETNVMQTLRLDLAFQFTKKIISQSKNFSNPKLSFTRNLIKSFFRIYDIFCTLCDFLQYFPAAHIRLFLSSPSLLIDLIDSYFKYSYNVKQKWQLNPDFILVFRTSMQGIRHKIIQFFLQVFDALGSTLAHRLQEQVWNDCVRVYYGVCLGFVGRGQGQGQGKDDWEELVNILIVETPHRQFFTCQPILMHVLTKQEYAVVQACARYQNSYRELLRKQNFDNQQLLALKLQSIKSYKQFCEFQLFTQDYTYSEQLSISSSLQQDSLLHMIESQLKTKKQQEQTRHKIDKTRRKMNKQLCRYPNFEHLEYNDQPVEEEEELVIEYGALGVGAWDQQEEDELTREDQYQNNYGHLRPKTLIQKSSQNRSHKPKKYIAKDQLTIQYKSRSPSPSPQPAVAASNFKKKPKPSEVHPTAALLQQLDLSIDVRDKFPMLQANNTNGIQESMLSVEGGYIAHRAETIDDDTDSMIDMMNQMDFSIPDIDLSDLADDSSHGFNKKQVVIANVDSSNTINSKSKNINTSNNNKSDTRKNNKKQSTKIQQNKHQQTKLNKQTIHGKQWQLTQNKSIKAEKNSKNQPQVHKDPSSNTSKSNTKSSNKFALLMGDDDQDQQEQPKNDNLDFSIQHNSRNANNSKASQKSKNRK